MSVGKALVLGATGQTGSFMVEELLGGIEPRVTGVVAYGNSRMPQYEGQRQELLDCRQCKMADLVTSRASELEGFDTVFFHVGTQRAKAGLEGQMLLEYDHSLEAAKLALQGGCKACHLVSSIGASSTASTSYFRTKGRIEQALQDLGFEVLYIYRPGGLYGGDRSGGFFRKRVLGLFMPTIHVREVAKAMRVTALRNAKGVLVLENKELLKLAKEA